VTAVLLVVPTGEDDTETRRLVALAAALADQPNVELTTLLWFGGPLVPEFATFGPSIDASTVNRWGPARTLARAGLTPVARGLKNRRLRDLLAPLRPLPPVVLGGPGAVGAVGWLPGPAPHTTCIVREPVGADDAWRRAVAEADLVVATDPAATTWALDDVGVSGDRVRRHALLEADDDDAPARPAVGLAGWSADEVARLAAEAATPLTWFVDEEAAWALWQGPEASPVATRVHVAPTRARAEDVRGLTTLLIGATGPTTSDLAAAAASAGAVVQTLGARAVARAVEALAAPVPEPGADDDWTLAVAEGVRALAAELPSA
jgi:hypothetical protein